MAKIRKQNINFMISDRLNKRVTASIKNNSKNSSVPEIIGCSIQEVRIYLESKFLPGMSWDNWSKNGWHIYHIKPCYLFNLTKDEEIKECFHYTNLQPLWAKDNLSHTQHSDILKKIELTNKPRNVVVYMNINANLNLPEFLAKEIEKILKDERVGGKKEWSIIQQ